MPIAVKLTETTELEARRDLHRGAMERLREAAYKARVACDEATHGGVDPLEKLALAEKWLAEAKRHALAAKSY